MICSIDDTIHIYIYIGVIKYLADKFSLFRKVGNHFPQVEF